MTLHPHAARWRRSLLRTAVVSLAVTSAPSVVPTAAATTLGAAAAQSGRYFGAAVAEHGDGVISLVDRHSGLAMDVWGASTADGACISQWNYTGNANQRFELQRG